MAVAATTSSSRPPLLGEAEGEAPSPETDGAWPEPERGDLTHVLFFSTLAGLCKWLPVPLLDDLLVPLLRRHMVRAQLAQAGLSLDGRQARKLARDPGFCPRCARKLCYYGCFCFLLECVCHACCLAWTVKESVDVTSTLLHEGWLVAFCLKAGHLREEILGQEVQLWRIRQAILLTCRKVDTSPITKALRKAFSGSRELLRRSADQLQGALRRRGVARGSSSADVEAALGAVEEEEREELEGLEERLAEALVEQRPYFRRLAATFEAQLTTLVATDAKPPSWWPEF